MIKHGTPKGWHAGCRDRCCWTAYNTHASKKHRLKKSKPGYVPLADRLEDRAAVAEKLKRLCNEAHWSRGTLALELGTTGKAVSNLIYQTARKRVTRETYDKIMSLPMEPPRLRPDTDPKSRVSSVGTRRRLQAMVLLGHDIKTLAKYCGLDESSLRRAMQENREVTEANTVRKVIDLYNTVMWMGVPQGMIATRARNYAQKNGFLPGGVWSHIDDPHCTPETGRLRKGKLS